MNKFIDRLKLFGLDEKLAKKMASVFSTQIILNKNDYLLKEKSVCKQLWFIMEGMCRYFYLTENGNEVTRWVSLENEFVTSFGSFIKQSNSNENIQAIKKSKILIAQKEDWDSLCEEDEFIRIFWAKSLEEHLIGIEARVYSLIALNAESKYDSLIQDYPKLVRDVPNKYLASILGINPRHLTRLRASKK
jgi:CRP-like cAMP-binding protein